MATKIKEQPAEKSARKAKAHARNVILKLNHIARNTAGYTPEEIYDTINDGLSVLSHNHYAPLNDMESYLSRDQVAHISFLISALTSDLLREFRYSSINKLKSK